MTFGSTVSCTSDENICVRVKSVAKLCSAFGNDATGDGAAQGSETGRQPGSTKDIKKIAVEDNQFVTKTVNKIK